MNGELMEQVANFMLQRLASKTYTSAYPFDQITCIYETGSALLHSQNPPFDPMSTKLNPIYAFI